MEAPRFDCAADPCLTQPNAAQLAARYDAVLPVGELRQTRANSGVSSARYAGISHTGTEFAPGFGIMGRMETEQRLFAVRGATQVEANEADAILAATEELMKELISRNGLTAEAMVSCLFTTTEDLDAEFPAVAARRIGLDQVPLLCCREIPVPGSMPRVIRVMAHYYAPVGHVPAHVYMGGAEDLRRDLQSAQ
ncbi:MAG TPA: chorismate mutase [Solirubrobacterales bacterium]|nr:chorismate mutase [Solirubrobacterales bacterium]